MKLFTLILTVSLLVQSCNFNTDKNSKEPEEVLINTALQIDSFTEWPEEIVGCSCYSSKNREDFRKQHYLVIDDYFSKALIKVNGRTETLNLISNDTLNSRKERLKTWKNNDFELNIKTIEIDAIDEIWVHEGTLTLTSENKQTIEIEIFGHCGC